MMFASADAVAGRHFLAAFALELDRRKLGSPIGTALVMLVHQIEHLEVLDRRGTAARG
jgi:hypothetical protein